MLSFPAVGVNISGTHIAGGWLAAPICTNLVFDQLAVIKQSVGRSVCWLATDGVDDTSVDARSTPLGHNTKYVYSVKVFRVLCRPRSSIIGRAKAMVVVVVGRRSLYATYLFILLPFASSE